VLDMSIEEWVCPKCGKGLIKGNEKSLKSFTQQKSLNTIDTNNIKGAIVINSFHEKIPEFPLKGKFT
jgi:PHP family Zn ribbon phosphoesterase